MNKEQSLEYNFIYNQLEANNKIKVVLENEITTLLNLVHQKRQWLDQINKINNELNLRFSSFNQNNSILVKHSIIENNNEVYNDTNPRTKSS